MIDYPQLIASGSYIGIEAATAAILQKNPGMLPGLTQLAADLPAIANGTILPAEEAADLASIVQQLQASQGQNGVIIAALLDGTVTQVQSNVNHSAPSILTGVASSYVLMAAHSIAAGCKVVASALPVPSKINVTPPAPGVPVPNSPYVPGPNSPGVAGPNPPYPNTGAQVPDRNAGTSVGNPFPANPPVANPNEPTPPIPSAQAELMSPKPQVPAPPTSDLAAGDQLATPAELAARKRK